MKVYGVTGLPGSGKSIISKLAKKEGIHTISMGDVIRKEAEKSNCSTGEAAINLRRQYGNNVVADRCVKEIFSHSRKRNNKPATVKKIYDTKTKHNPPKKFKKIEQDVYIIEGIRSPQEVKYFKRHFKNFKIIAIHSNPRERFNRLLRRKRSDDSTDYRDFVERDNRELRFGIGNVIARADYMLINEGSIQKVKKSAKVLIQNELKPRPKFNRNPSFNKNNNKQNRKFNKSKKQYPKYNNPKNNNKQKRR